MMYEASVQNTNGDLLNLTQSEDRWQLYRIDGLTPPRAQINMTAIAGMDGARFNSSKLNTRNIVLYFKLNGDAEENRLTLYHYFRAKQNLTFFFANGRRNVRISGYVDTVSCTIFDRREIMQVSIICPDPLFYAISGTTEAWTDVYGLFEFPFSINEGEPVPFSEYDLSGAFRVYNDGDMDFGMTITIDVLEACSSIVLKNLTTNETFTLSDSFLQNEHIVINTRSGKKSITSNAGHMPNYSPFSWIVPGSVFLQLHVGENRLQYSVDGVSESPKAKVTFEWQMAYMGV